MITQLEVYNYRCLRAIRQPLRRFHVLIGRNGSGKSTFLDVLLFLQHALLADLETAVYGAELDLIVPRTQKDFQDLLHRGMGRSFTFAVVAKVPAPVRKDSQLQYGYCRYQVRIGADEQNELAVLTEGLWLLPDQEPHDFKEQQQKLWETDSDPEALQDWFWFRGKRRFRTPKGWKRVIRREGRVAHFWSETTRWNFPQSVSPLRLALDLVDEERFPVSAWLREFLSERVYPLQLNPRRMREPCPALASDAFALDGSNLPKVLKRLKEEDPARFRRWLTHVQSVIKGLKEIDVREREEDKALYLVLRYEGHEVKQWGVSEGTLRFLALTLLGYLPEEGVWLIEEPENGIHPQALEAVIEALATAEESLQVLVATHSPVIVDCKDYISPYDVLCFRLEGDATVICSAADLMRERKISERVTLTLGDLMAWGVL